MPQAEFSKVFLIGFNRCGGSWFREVFMGAGLRWRHDQTGDLAADIAYHRANGSRPLDRWPRLQGVSGLERWNKPHLPRIEAFRYFAFLQQQFPDALFIYNDRDPADWIASRFFHRDGRFAMREAQHRRCELRDLPEIWLKERAAHKLRVLRHFDGDPRFLHFDISHDPDGKLFEWAAGWLPLGEMPADRGIEDPEEAVVQIDMLADALREEVTRPRHRPGRPDMDFVDGVVSHCMGRLREGVAEGDGTGLSSAAATWQVEGQAGETVCNRKGRDWGLVRDPDLGFLVREQGQAVDRIQAVLNDLLRLGAVPPVTVDMQDTREVGIGERAAPPGPTLVYNRRPGARNLILWPLPGYHTLAPEGQPGGFPSDEIAFADKPDLCIWYGNLTGKPLELLSPGLSERRMAHQYLQELGNGTTGDRRQEIGRALSAITRFRVVSRLFGKPGFELGFVLPPKHDAAAADALISRFVTPRQPETWVHRGRYVLSLSGNDTGSNFLISAASNGVVLKEEDGWELFYTHAFKPWEHYIPLGPGGDDIEPRLDWARSNPQACLDMSRAATAMVARFAAPENQRAWSLAIYEELRGLRG